MHGMKYWEDWWRKWVYCPICEMSWFEDGGQDPTCTCKGEEK